MKTIRMSCMNGYWVAATYYDAQLLEECELGDLAYPSFEALEDIVRCYGYILYADDSAVA